MISLFIIIENKTKKKKKTVNICKYEQIEKQNYHKSLTVNVILIIIFNLSYVNLILTRPFVFVSYDEHVVVAGEIKLYNE